MLTLILLALGLSADAVAVAIGEGAAAEHVTPGRVLSVGLMFGAVQTVMLAGGWALSIALQAVRHVDPWLALIMLTVAGGRMIQDGWERHRSTVRSGHLVTAGALAGATFATSLDAAAAGALLPLLEVPVLVACGVIGCVTLVLTSGGVVAGAIQGHALARKIELGGGLLLIMVGCKVVMDHAV